MSQSKLSITTPPAASLLALADVKTYLRIDAENTSEDALLAELINVATDKVQSLTGRSLLTTVYALQVDRFRPIELPKPPLVSVDSITYYDVAGVQQTLATTSYEVDSADDPSVVIFLTDLPALESGRTLPITINYTAGYGALAVNIPSSISTYAKMLVGDLLDGSRSTSSQYELIITPTARSIISPYIL